jgi:hypothetical protein
MKTNALFENELEVFKRRGGCARGKQGKVKGNDGRGYWEQRNVKNKMKIEKMKKEKEIREMKELQQVPKISKRSKDIVRKLNNEYNNKCKTNREESYVKEVKEKCQRKRNLIEMLCLSRRMRKEEEDEEMKLKMNLQHTTPSRAITKVNYTNSNNESNDNNNELLQLRKRINEYYYKHKRIGNHGVIYNPIQPYSCSTNNNNNVNNGNNINIQNSHQYLHTH